MMFLVLVGLVSGCLAGNLVEEIQKAGATTALSLIQSVGLDKSLAAGKGLAMSLIQSVGLDTCLAAGKGQGVNNEPALVC